MEVFPVDEAGRRYLWLRDPADTQLPLVAIAREAAPFLALLDGQRTIAEACAVSRGGGGTFSLAEAEAFLLQLDEAGYLDGPRANHRLAERRRLFHEATERFPVHAGGSYPADTSTLPAFLAAGYLDRAGPGALPGTRPLAARPPPRAIIAPHVDLHRGAPTYSWAYRVLAESEPADLYLVLGTCHTPVEGYFAATRKPYGTPLGAVPTDSGFLDRLSRLWGQDLFAGEFSHAAEHSVEFQALYLRSLGLVGEGAAPMVAIMCDSLRSLVMPEFSPRDVALVADLVAALRQTIAEDGRRITLVAAVDLAHVGPRFGDTWRVDADRLGAVGREDRAMLDLVAAGDAEGYFAQVMRDDDARRICGLTPLYLLAELVSGAEGPDATGQLLRYTQWAAPDGSSSVTFASMLFR